jgi:hypothetical protein
MTASSRKIRKSSALSIAGAVQGGKSRKDGFKGGPGAWSNRRRQAALLGPDLARSCQRPPIRLVGLIWPST